MANITFHVANRYSNDTTWEAQYYGAQTTTNFEVLDSSGVLREANLGTNFTYGSNGFFNSGMINTIYSFSADGTLTFSVNELSLSVYDRNNSLTIGTSSYSFYTTMMSGNDNITGSSGDDQIYGSKGNDTIDGGGGLDVLSYKGFGTSVNVNLGTGTATNYYGISSIVNVEDVEGTTYGDVLTGNASNNSFQGFAGNDTISGGSGSDTASYLDATYAVTVNLSTGTATGGSGSDTLSSIERVIGSRFNDTLTGSSVNESFFGGFGNDSINGGNGVDTVEYSGVGSGVTVNLTSGTTSGGAGTDTLVNIDNVKGSIFADLITGNSAANILYGSSGNDTINGNNGNDVLSGDLGNDKLAGGSGKDTFVFNNALTTTNKDAISDFMASDDTIRLDRSYFGKLSVGNLSASLFKASASGMAGDANDYILYNTASGALLYDADGNGAGVATQFAALTTKPAITAADFTVIA